MRCAVTDGQSERHWKTDPSYINDKNKCIEMFWHRLVSGWAFISVHDSRCKHTCTTIPFFGTHSALVRLWHAAACLADDVKGKSLIEEARHET